jgi:hypothetical protein
MPNTIRPTLSAEIEALAQRAPDSDAKAKLLEMAALLEEPSNAKANQDTSDQHSFRKIAPASS